MFPKLPETATLPERTWDAVYRAICLCIFAFLLLPLFVIVPLSFNSEAYFTFTPGMLAFDPSAFSLRWYRELAGSAQWRSALANSMIVGLFATVIATVLGTLAAIGLWRSQVRGSGLIMALLLSPMVVPVVIVAAALYFSFTSLGLSQTLTGLVLAHAMLGAPLVVTTVSATLSGFDRNLLKAAANLGASHARIFRTVMLPIIWPGVLSGALFAFVTSLDEVVVVLFLAGPDQRTIPRQMWSGMREQLSPTILAAATLLIIVSAALLVVAEVMRRRSERLRGLTPS